MREIAKVIDMQDRTVHDQRILTDGDSLWTGMQITALVKIDVFPEVNVIGKAQPHAVLNGRDTLHVQQQRVCEGAQSDSYQCGNPTKEGENELLDTITPEAAGLAG
jgi:hypothetical protein